MRSAKSLSLSLMGVSESPVSSTFQESRPLRLRRVYECCRTSNYQAALAGCAIAWSDTNSLEHSSGMNWLPRLELHQVLAHCQVSGFRDRYAAGYTTRQMVAREGSAP